MKFLTQLFFLLIAILPLSAQVDSIPASPALIPDFPLVENSLLWEISGKELENPSYLYGTIHMIAADDFFLTPATKVAFAESERVAFEINMEEMNSLTVMFSLIGQVMMDGGMTLKKLLSEEDYGIVKKHFDDIGMPLFMLERVKPMFLSAFATGDMSGESMQSGAIKSYEMEFMEMAQQEELEMAGLETIQYQMSIFDSIPYPVQAEMLVESIRVTDTEDDQFSEMVKLYKNQDLAGMHKMFEAEEGGLGDYEDVMLNNRNRNWIPVMEEMMADKKTFFAVGAGHLGGRFGVVNLLREAGYTVSPVK